MQQQQRLAQQLRKLSPKIIKKLQKADRTLFNKSSLVSNMDMGIDQQDEGSQSGIKKYAPSMLNDMQITHYNMIELQIFQLNKEIKLNANKVDKQQFSVMLIKVKQIMEETQRFCRQIKFVFVYQLFQKICACLFMISSVNYFSTEIMPNQYPDKTGQCDSWALRQKFKAHQKNKILFNTNGYLQNDGKTFEQQKYIEKFKYQSKGKQRNHQKKLKNTNKSLTKIDQNIIQNIKSDGQNIREMCKIRYNLGGISLYNENYKRNLEKKNYLSGFRQYFTQNSDKIKQQFWSTLKDQFKQTIGIIKSQQKDQNIQQDISQNIPKSNSTANKGVAQLNEQTNNQLNPDIILKSKKERQKFAQIKVTDDPIKNENMSEIMECLNPLRAKTAQILIYDLQFRSEVLQNTEKILGKIGEVYKKEKKQILQAIKNYITKIGLLYENKLMQIERLYKKQKETQVKYQENKQQSSNKEVGIQTCHIYKVKYRYKQKNTQNIFTNWQLSSLLPLSQVLQIEQLQNSQIMKLQEQLKRSQMANVSNQQIIAKLNDKIMGLHKQAIRIQRNLGIKDKKCQSLQKTITKLQRELQMCKQNNMEMLLQNIKNSDEYDNLNISAHNSSKHKKIIHKKNKPNKNNRSLDMFSQSKLKIPQKSVLFIDSQFRDIQNMHDDRLETSSHFNRDESIYSDTDTNMGARTSRNINTTKCIDIETNSIKNMTSSAHNIGGKNRNAARSQKGISKKQVNFKNYQQMDGGNSNELYNKQMEIGSKEEEQNIKWKRQKKVLKFLLTNKGNISKNNKKSFKKLFNTCSINVPLIYPNYKSDNAPKLQITQIQKTKLNQSGNQYLIECVRCKNNSKDADVTKKGTLRKQSKIYEITIKSIKTDYNENKTEQLNIKQEVQQPQIQSNSIAKNTSNKIIRKNANKYHACSVLSNHIDILNTSHSNYHLNLAINQELNKFMQKEKNDSKYKSHQPNLLHPHTTNTLRTNNPMSKSYSKINLISKQNGVNTKSHINLTNRNTKISKTIHILQSQTNRQKSANNSNQGLKYSRCNTSDPNHNASHEQNKQNINSVYLKNHVADNSPLKYQEVKKNSPFHNYSNGGKLGLSQKWKFRFHQFMEENATANNGRNRDQEQTQNKKNYIEEQSQSQMGDFIKQKSHIVHHNIKQSTNQPDHCRNRLRLGNSSNNLQTRQEIEQIKTTSVYQRLFMGKDNNINDYYSKNNKKMKQQGGSRKLNRRKIYQTSILNFPSGNCLGQFQSY